MEIIARRTGEQLVLGLQGRMDGTGAQQVTAAVQQNLNDHDAILIFDMNGVDYLSSAGLRVFQEYARRMKERKGSIAVCRLQDFVRKLFTSGGFFHILVEYPTVEAALAATAPASDLSAGEVTLSGTGWKLSARHITRSPGTLMVTGSLRALHSGVVSADNIREIHIPDDAFSLGIGAMAATPGDASPLAGEMVQAAGSVYWIPTDGQSNPDFFTKKDASQSGMKTFSFFSVTVDGPFSDVLKITSDKPDGIALSDLYGAVFSYLRQQYPDFTGACAIALKATVGGICSSDLKTSLLAAAAQNAGKNGTIQRFGHTVESPFLETAMSRASVVDVRPKYAGNVLIGIGYGIDTAAAGKAFPGATIPALTETGSQGQVPGIFQYTKGMIFRSLQWDNARPFEEELRTAPVTAEFVAMHNLLAITTVKSAVVGIIPVYTIRNQA